MSYLFHLIGVLLPQLVAVAAIQVVYRRGGLIVLNFGAVMGIGGYTYALLAASGHIGVIYALGLAALAAGLSAILLYPALRLGDSRFILISLCLQLVFIAVCRASVVTGGEGGLRGLPDASLGGIALPAGGGLSLLVQTAMCAALIVILLRLEKSSLDLKLRAVSDDPGLVDDLGLSSRYIRLSVLAIAFAVTGAAGVLSTAFRGGVSPDDYGIGLSVLLLSAAALAWDRSILAALVTGSFLATSAEALRAIGVDSNVEKIFYGVLIILAIGRGKLYV